MQQLKSQRLPMASKEIFPLNTGKRQGQPPSPVIFTASIY